MSVGTSLEDKKKRLNITLKKLHKEHGAGSVNLYPEMPKLDVKAVSTGSLGLDYALGVGGVARGRVVEIYGPESSGKTTLMLHAIAEVQKAGGLAAFIDAEHALDPIYAEALGVNMEELVISQPDNGEQALNIAEELTESGTVDIIVIDSVAALTPKAEIDGEVGDHHVGLQARMLSQACRKLASVAHKTDTTLVFINQIRMKIGVMFGSPETTSGGQALKFYASQRIDIRRIGTLKENDQAIGVKTRVKVVKNKVAPPFRQAEFDIYFGKGINKAGEVLDASINLGLIEKAGSWYKYDGTSIAQGRDAAVDWLKENSSIYAAIEHNVRKKLGLTKDEN